ncbi:MAG: OadG family protein [Oscillospiraceae bacterium]|nr:OadG family protein [Oscillospiraceae bacterium]
MQIMMEVAASGTKLPFGDNVLTAVLGYGVVFVGLMILMAIVYAMGAIFKKLTAREKPLPAASLPKSWKAAPEPEPEGEPAPGSAGEIKLYNVSDKEAAMIMAIVASQMGKPLNELRFKSIKEVTDK